VPLLLARLRAFARPLAAAATLALTACSGDDKGDSATGGDLQTAEFQGECDGLFSCPCEDHGYGDAATCAEVHAVEWAGIEASAAGAGLTADLACYTSSLPFTAYACKTFAEVEDAVDPDACTYCQFAHGDRAKGEPCVAYDYEMSDCAQGLRCSFGKDATCVDPCAPAGLGESCEVLSCDVGLGCDYDTDTCVAAGGEGEPCLGDPPCDAGLVCDIELNLCTPGATEGKSCAVKECVEGLVCTLDTTTCAKPAGPGEPCGNVTCVDGYTCSWLEELCVPPGADGESCTDRPCIDGLACAPDTELCGPLPGEGEPCIGLCAAGLFCNFLEVPEVCVVLPGAGEPCLIDNYCADGLVCDYASNTCGEVPPLVCYG